MCSGPNGQLAGFLGEQLSVDTSETDRIGIADALGTDDCVAQGSKEQVTQALVIAGQDKSPRLRRTVYGTLLSRGEETLATPILIGLMKENSLKGHLGGEFHSFRNSDSKKYAAQELKKASNDPAVLMNTRATFATIAAFLNPETFDDDSVSLISQRIKQAERGDSSAQKEGNDHLLGIVNLAKKHPESAKLRAGVERLLGAAAQSSNPDQAAKARNYLEEVRKPKSHE
jgi:hypothetical protein